MGSLTILRAGPALSVQDLGRPGHLSEGLSPGGAMDRLALLEAAALLDLPDVVPAIEMASTGGRFSVDAPMRIALTGAPMKAAVDGAPAPWAATVLLLPGQVLEIGGATAGTYGYLTPAGGIRSPDWLGSRSAHLVIGVGGLGAYAIQFLKLLSPATVFAVDRAESRLDDARRFGADHAIRSDDRSAEAIMDLTGGRGADLIIDLVGNNATLALAAAVSRPHGRIVLVGLEGGTLEVGWGKIATTCEFAISLGSTVSDLQEVCRLAADGRLIIDYETFALDDVEVALSRLREGKLNGRAVVSFP